MQNGPAPRLSVIIVNYNVQHFLQQCLQSVRNASVGLGVEVFVVDNASVDGSVEMVTTYFPEVRLIANTDNVGFSRANNQAMALAQGDYVLLLNPDTLVEEDTFSTCLNFMDAHPDAGGLGVRMIDGKGHFLPESKRSLPTPEVAFYKIFGLSALFPNSTRFGKYHLTFLSEFDTHEIEVLSGAFMLMRTEALRKTGFLDEDFFMYGEDIDLSYRIIKQGYKNYYLPEARIIHYKGESTKKGSLNYVYVFYNAMAIFARKHFSAGRATAFGILIQFAIVFRATVAALHRLAKSFALPVFDAVALFVGLSAIARIWEDFFKSDEGIHYPPQFYLYLLPVYMLIWMVSMVFSGSYDTPYRLTRVARAMGLGSVVVILIYALLPEHIRFSRAVVLLGSAWAVGWGILSRWTLDRLRIAEHRLERVQGRRYAIVGQGAELQRVEHLLRDAVARVDAVFHVAPGQNLPPQGRFVGHTGQLTDIVAIHAIDEVVFCSANLTSKKIIELMCRPFGPDIDFKIAPTDMSVLMGSNSIDTAATLYMVGIGAIGKPSAQRLKRLFDLASSFTILLFWPLAFLAQPSFIRVISEALNVLIGRKTWVSYSQVNAADLGQLPKLRPGVTHPLHGVLFEHQNFNQPANMFYARTFGLRHDFAVLMRWLSVG